MNIDTDSVVSLLSDLESNIERLAGSFDGIHTLMDNIKAKVEEFKNYNEKKCQEKYYYVERGDYIDLRHEYTSINTHVDGNIEASCDIIINSIEKIKDIFSGLSSMINQNINSVNGIVELYNRSVDNFAEVNTKETVLNFREKGNVNSKIIGKIPKGSSIKLLDNFDLNKEQEYTLVEINGVKGYVATKYLTKMPSKVFYEYEVQPGDTLSAITDRINKKYHSDYTYDEIAKMSHISNADYIEPGQIIRIAGNVVATGGVIGSEGDLLLKGDFSRSIDGTKYYKNGQIMQETTIEESKKTVKNYNEDGSIKSIYKYTTDKEGKNHLESIYQNNGNEETSKKFQNGKLIRKEENSFNDDGDLEKKHFINYNESGKKSKEYTYDKNSSEKYSSCETKWTYDEDGKIKSSKSKYINKDMNVGGIKFVEDESFGFEKGKGEICRIRKEYDENDKLVKTRYIEKYYDENNEIKFRDINEEEFMSRYSDYYKLSSNKVVDSEIQQTSILDETSTDKPTPTSQSTEIHQTIDTASIPDEILMSGSETLNKTYSAKARLEAQEFIDSEFKSKLGEGTFFDNKSFLDDSDIDSLSKMDNLSKEAKEIVQYAKKCAENKVNYTDIIPAPSVSDLAHEHLSIEVPENKSLYIDGQKTVFSSGTKWEYNPETDDYHVVLKDGSLNPNTHYTVAQMIAAKID